MSAIDLTDLAAVRRHLQRLDPSADEQDEVIGDLITAYSRLIIGNYREFAPAAEAADRTIEIDPLEWLHPLAPYDCRAATAVVLDQGKTTERTLIGEEWTLAKYDPEHGVWKAIELHACIGYAPLRSGHTLTITGDWGFSEIPEDAELACRLAVVMALRGDVQAFGSALQPNSFGEGLNDDQALPPGVRGLLRRFRRGGAA